MPFRKIYYLIFTMFIVLFLIPKLDYGITITPKAPVEKKPSTQVSQAVTDITVRGNYAVEEQEILEPTFSKIGDPFIKEKVDNDLKAIYSLGYFQDISASYEAYAGGVRIIFNIKENPVVKKISIEGNTVMSTAEILDLMKTKEEKILNFKTLQNDIQTINDELHKKGYIMARIVDVTTDPETQTLKLQLVEGIVESIVIKGNDNTKDYVIAREMEVKPGDVLNEKELSKDLRRIFNLGFFSEVSPNFEAGSTKDKIVLVINIKESKTSTINFGGGYGEREGWFGFVDLNVNNLLGTGHNTMIRGQWGQITTYQFMYYYPWFLPETLGPRTSMTYRVWNTAGPDIYGNEIQDAMRVGWDMKFTRPFKEYFSHSIMFGSETVTPREDPASFEAYLSDFIGYSIAYDTRDFWLNPMEGKYYTISIKKGWKKTDNITNYSKLGLDLNDFFKLASNQVLATHIGTGVGFGDVPIGELYWAGGANTVRGYFPSEARSGIKKLIFNVEYRYQFNEMFQGVIFYDFGDSWGEVDLPGGGPDLANFMSGRGFGLRLNTPLGPIRLDYGIGDSKSVSEGVVHFSIGQAF